MRVQWTTALVGLVAGVGIGYLTGTATSAGPVPTDDATSARVAELELELERLRADAPVGRVERTRLATEDRSPEAREVVAVETTDPPVSAEPAVADVDDGAEARRRSAEVSRIAATLPVLFDRKDGLALVDALKELAALAPEGRAAAMELAVRINEDVSGPGDLQLSQFTFYTSLGDAAVKDLMTWSLATQGESTPEFRTISAWSLPWVQPPETTIAQFAEALRTEPDVNAQRGMVFNLAGMKRPAADQVLVDVLSDANRDATLRAQVATRLATTEDPQILAALEQAASSDPDASVRSSASAALIARDPPETGYLVTGVLPDGQASASDLRAGDIVVAYDGRETRDQRALQEAAAEVGGQAAVEVVVVRGGERVTVVVNPGRLGIYGRAVERREER